MKSSSLLPIGRVPICLAVHRAAYARDCRPVINTSEQPQSHFDARLRLDAYQQARAALSQLLENIGRCDRGYIDFNVCVASETGSKNIPLRF